MTFEEMARKRGLSEPEEIEAALAGMSEAEDEAPLFARIATVVGAWISGIFVALFIGMLLRDSIDTPPVATFVGLGIVIATLILFRRNADLSRIPRFIEQLALASYLAGMLLLLYGVISWAYDLNSDLEETLVAFLVASVLGVVVHLVSRHPVQQYLAVGWFVGTCLVATFEQESAVLFGIGLAVVLALYLARWMDTGSIRLPDSLGWSGLSGTIAFLVALATASDRFQEDLVEPGRIIAAVAIPLSIVASGWLIRGPWLRLSPLAVIAAVALLAAISWIGAPGVAFALGLMWIAHATADLWYGRIAPLLLAFFLIVFYYSLTTTLLAKSVWMMSIGVVLMIGGFALKRWKPSPSPDP